MAFGDEDLDTFLSDFAVPVVYGATSTRGILRVYDQGNPAPESDNSSIGRWVEVLVKTGSLPGLAQETPITVNGPYYRVHSFDRMNDGAFTKLTLQATGGGPISGVAASAMGGVLAGAVGISGFSGTAANAMGGVAQSAAAFTGNDVAQLVANLGGDTVVSAIYDVRFGITLSGSNVAQLDDARGATGFGPSLAQATSGKQPPFTGGSDAAKNITFPNSVNRTLITPAVAAFDLSTPKTLVLIGAFPAPVATAAYAGGINDSNSVNGAILIEFRSDTSLLHVQFWPGPQLVETTVPVSANVRALFATTNGSTTGLAEVPNAGQKSHSISAIGSRNCALVFGSYWDNAVNGGGFVFRAALVLSGAYTSTQRDTIDAWAVANHAAVLA